MTEQRESDEETVATVAEMISRSLAYAGGKRAFGVVGGGNVQLVAALTASGAQYVPARHEGGAMAMADAYYRTTGDVAICTTSHGAAFNNLVSGLAEAVKHRSGVLVLCGDAPVGRLRPHDTDQAAVARTLGAEVVRLTDPKTAWVEAADALELARTHQRPVVLLVPNGLARKEILPDPAVYAPRSTVESARRAELGPMPDVLARACRPLLLAGRGAWRSGAENSIADLGDRIGALFATTVMASGMFDGTGWCLGIFGGFSSPQAGALIHEADLVIAFGASLDEFTLHGGRILNPQATLIQIDIEHTPSVERIDIGVIGDAAFVAAALAREVDVRALPASHWREERAADLDRVSWIHDHYIDMSSDDRIDPRTLSRTLNKLLPPCRTLVLDGGHFIGWPIMYWDVSEPSALAFMGAATQAIGLGFAGAVGAAVGRPDRTTVLATGDGGARMGLSELETLIRTDESVLVVIYNDDSYGFEAHMYAPEGADLDTVTFAETDFARVARALGAVAVTVRSVEDLAAVRSWRDSRYRGTLVLDCKIVPGVVAKYLSDILAAR